MKIFLSALIIFLTHLQEGITGFGGSVMALPFLNLTIGLKSAVQLLALFGWVMALYIVIRSSSHIDWHGFSVIARWAGLGLPAGLLLFDLLPAEYLCMLLGIFMIIVGINGFVCRKITNNSYPGKKASIWMKILLFTGGIFQGAFGTGGPCIVIYTAKTMPDKSLFRVTLSLLWLAMNSCRIIFWTVKGNFWNTELIRNFFIILPFMAAGLILGDFLHTRISEQSFRSAVYILLGISGVLMLVNNLSSLISA